MWLPYFTYRAVQAGPGTAAWCKEQFLNLRHLQFAADVRGDNVMFWH